MKNAERVDLLLYTDHDESVMHYELQGCATDVVSITGDALAKNPEYIQVGMVAEILWGEADRSSEPEILKRVEGIVGVRGTVKDDIPKLFWRHWQFAPSTMYLAIFTIHTCQTGSASLGRVKLPPLSRTTEMKFKFCIKFIGDVI